MGNSFRALIFLLAIFTGTAVAELPWTYPPGDLSQDAKHLLEEAANYLDRGDLESARERLLVVAAEYGGTGIEAETLLSLAQIAALDGDNSTRRSKLEEVMTRFPNSVFAFKARVALLTTDGYFDGGFEGRASAFDDFAQELGGPSFEEVAIGSLSTSAASSVLQLQFEKKIALRGLYTSCYFE